MKKLFILLPITFSIVSCAELQQVMREIQQSEQHIAQQQNVAKQPRTVKSNHVVKVKQRPNNGKQVIKNGIKYPEEFSLDENGNLRFNPTFSNQAIRELNRITEKGGVTIQGY